MNYLKLLAILTFSCVTFQGHAQGSEGEDYGPWPHQYFKAGERLSCYEADPCVLPRMDDLEALKKDWVTYELSRIERLKRLQDLARQRAEKVLEVAQIELSENESSAFGNLYLGAGSKLLENLEDSQLKRTELWVSQSSPVVDKIVELESNLIEWQNQIDMQQDPDLKEGLQLLRKEKYREWFLSAETIEIFKSLGEIQLNYFPKQSANDDVEQKLVESLLILKVPLIKDHIKMSGCPTKIEGHMEKVFGAVQFSEQHRVQGEWDPIKDKEFLKFILSGKYSGTPLTIKCRKGGFLSGPSVKYDSRHFLEINYKTKKGENGVTLYKVPPRQEILKTLK